MQVQFIANAAAGDQALVDYDPVAKTLQIDIRPGVTTARTVVEAVNATGVFAARLDDQLDAANDGSGLVDVTATATLAGGSGIVFDQDAGIQLVNRGETYTIRFADAETVEDLLNALNHSAAGVAGQHQRRGNRDRRPVARQRGRFRDWRERRRARPPNWESGPSRKTPGSRELNHGLGVSDAAGTDFVIRRRDGQLLEIDVASAQTIGDVLDLINQHPANVGPAVVARLAEFGNGIELLDANLAGSESLAVLRRSGSAAWDLGLVPQGEDESSAEVVATPAGPAERVRGRDVGPLETEGVFNSLIRLNAALEQPDLQQIERRWPRWMTTSTA